MTRKDHIPPSSICLSRFEGLTFSFSLYVCAMGQFIFYAVITNILSLERTAMKKKLVDGTPRFFSVFVLSSLKQHTLLIFHSRIANTLK